MLSSSETARGGAGGGGNGNETKAREMITSFISSAASLFLSCDMISFALNQDRHGDASTGGDTHTIIS
jgi:hypothetical protein